MRWERALVTGASAGLGAEFARQLAAEGTSLVVVARDEARLTALAEALHVDVEVLPADLRDPDQLAGVEERLRAGGIDLRVNNAGLGTQKPFPDSPVDAEMAMVDLHVTAVVRLTHAALGPMRAARKGAVANVASVAGLVPGLAGSTYAGTKAFEIHFSESLHNVVKPDGVTVTAVCPGFTRTEFHERAGISMSAVPEWGWMAASDVVRESLADIAAGKAMSVPGKGYTAVAALVGALPRPLVRRAVRVLERD